MKIAEKKQLVENTPWDLLTEDRFEQFPYSGLLIKVFRISRSWNNRMLGRQLGLRASTISRLETKEKLGIKLAKQLANEFNIPNYRIFRARKDLDKFMPSPKAKEAIVQAKTWFEDNDIFLISLTHSLTDKGKEALAATVRTRKRKFPESFNEIPLAVKVESTARVKRA